MYSYPYKHALRRVTLYALPCMHDKFATMSLQFALTKTLLFKQIHSYTYTVGDTLFVHCIFVFDTFLKFMCYRPAGSRKSGACMA